MKKVVIPVYQPIMDLHTHTVAHYEALARIRDDVGQAGHAGLIRMGEEVGFIDLIDLAMLEQVFEMLTAYPKISIAANLSVATIERSANEVLPLIYRHLDTAARLIVEITETVMIRDIAKLERFVGAARHAGCKVALDDYGSGHFTVEHIRLLRPEYVKLDGSLVEQLTNGIFTQVDAVKSAIAHYGGEIIAEVVDSEEKLLALVSGGIRYAQGFYIGRPSRHIMDEIEVKELSWEEGQGFFGKEILLACTL
jgi:EAL domain-containing protein (putative c-di-GMP-specific phosphodiesterase class I)